MTQWNSYAEVFGTSDGSWWSFRNLIMDQPRYSSIGKTTSLELNNNLAFNSAIESLTPGSFFESIRQDEKRSTKVIYGRNDLHEVSSIDSFKEMKLMKPLLKNICKRYGTSTTADADGATSEAQPTAVQCSVISYLLSENESDLAIRSPTGSGKTSAFLIPMIQRIHEEKLELRDPMEDENGPIEVNGESPFVIVLTPTRELAVQIYKEAVELTHDTSVKVACAIGEFRRHLNIQMLRLGCDIVIGTIGRVFDFLIFEDKQTDECVLKSDKLKFVVVDEFDRLSGLDRVESNLELLTKQKFFQNVRFVALSASFNFEDENPLLRDPTMINVKNEYPPMCLIQKFIDVQTSNGVQSGIKTVRPGKFDYLLAFCKHKADEEKRLPRMVVFVNQCHTAEFVSIRLLQEGYRAFSIHGRRNTFQRLETMQRFIRGDFDVLVSTDISARGLNVPVEFVFNYDLPHQRYKFVEYLHRVGRTGRMGSLGVAISFFDSDRDLEFTEMAIKILNHCREPIPDFLSQWNEKMIEKMIERAVAQSQSYANHGGLVKTLTARQLPDAVQVLTGNLKYI